MVDLQRENADLKAKVARLQREKAELKHQLKTSDAEKNVLKQKNDDLVIELDMNGTICNVCETDLTNVPYKPVYDYNS